MSKRNSRGFTLIEFMIVLCIIGILAAIAIPNFIANTHRAQDAKVSADMDVFQQSADAYRQDNGSYATSAAKIINAYPEKYDPTARRMRNAVTHKFSEPSSDPAPAAIIYQSDGKSYTIIGFDHRGDHLRTISGPK